MHRLDCRSLLPLSLLVACSTAGAQVQLGHKLLGTLGIDAATQPEPGVYLALRAVQFRSDQLRDREGNVVPIDFRLLARGAALGAARTVTLGRGTFLTFAASVPVARISSGVDDPRVSIDRAGLSDLYLMPFRFGWRSGRFDQTVSYGLYAPTGQFEPRGSVGRGHWTHQLSAGGAAYFDPKRRHRASALLSWDYNTRKRGIDFTRGSTVQLQGGVGVGVGALGTAGIAGYALRQVSDDRGADLPDALRGLRERVYGLGPEVQLVLPRLRMKVELRAMFDVGARARPSGDVLAGGVTYRTSAARR